MAGGDGGSDPSSLTGSEQPDSTRLDDAARSAIREHASPQGIVTILFTDIVESTRFRQRVGDHAAQERFRQHNEVVREQIKKHGGFEVKTQGDGFMVAFADVVAALACTVDIQRAVFEDNAQHPGDQLLVRMGLNCGQSIKEEEDFFGGVVIVAARISAKAKGGEILVSEAVRVLAGLPPGISYGRHQLKGLAGSYSVWSVAWGGEPTSGSAKLTANPAVRLGALALLGVAVIAAVVGGVMLNRNGGEPHSDGSVSDELVSQFSSRTVFHRASGDCTSEDAVYSGEFEGGESTGDISGRISGTVEYVAHVADQCQTGFVKIAFTITDAQENTLTGTLEGPVSAIPLLNAAEGQGAGIGTSWIVRYTAGTGIFAGATGGGTCDLGISAQFSEDFNTITGLATGKCKARLATAGAPVAAPEPLVVQLAANPLKATVSGDTFSPTSTVALAVIYGNAGDEMQRGLSLKLRVPAQTTILAVALGETQTVSGERTWALPDLAPGALHRFELKLRFLNGASSAPLVVEINGEGFERPIPSNVVTIEIVK